MRIFLRLFSSKNFFSLETYLKWHTSRQFDVNGRRHLTRQLSLYRVIVTSEDNKRFVPRKKLVVLIVDVPPIIEWCSRFLRKKCSRPKIGVPISLQVEETDNKNRKNQVNSIFCCWTHFIFNGKTNMIYVDCSANRRNGWWNSLMEHLFGTILEEAV